MAYSNKRIFNLLELTHIYGTKGGPQGFVLGPILFTTYTNDIISNKLYSNIFLFVDDTSITSSNLN